MEKRKRPNYQIGRIRCINIYIYMCVCCNIHNHIIHCNVSLLTVICIYLFAFFVFCIQVNPIKNQPHHTSTESLRFASVFCHPKTLQKSSLSLGQHVPSTCLVKCLYRGGQHWLIHLSSQMIQDISKQFPPPLVVDESSLTIKTYVG